MVVISLERTVAWSLVAVVVLGMIAPASAQDSRLKAALTACMTRAVTDPLPQMLDVDNAEAHLSTHARDNQRSRYSLRWSWSQIRQSRAM